jgi:chemotaxis protein histidine kinase CheA/ActR/RegA family two-component response regulator
MTKMDNSAEEQLQQELQEMFLIDTQRQLATYFDLTQRLQPTAWVADIQHIYRTIHTIKGGAVTVKAEAMLQAAVVLENLLSDLRYLEISPPLDDGQLSQMLLEAGELLASCLEISESGSAELAQVQPTIQRLQALHIQVKEGYLPDWNEMKQVHQDFAEQGFDLVALELEMSLRQLPATGHVPISVLTVGNSMLQQLQQIGQELDLAEGWHTLIQSCQELIDQGDCQQWRSHWPPYFELFKKCAKKSGQLSAELRSELGMIPASPDHDSSSGDSNRSALSAPSSLDQTDDQADDLNIEIGNEFAIDSFDFDPEDDFGTFDEYPDLDLEVTAFNPAADHPALDSHLEPPVVFGNKQLPDQQLASLLDNFWEDEEISPAIASSELSHSEFSESAPLEASAVELAKSVETETVISPISITPSEPAPDFRTEVRRNVQIPVPLERLDKSAQQVVDILLTTRGMNSQSHKLRSQLAQLTALTAESAQFTTRLRQLQDDYALLRSISDEQDSSHNLTFERYRQGYTTINRLLENILRMSELGGELETSTHQTFESLAHLDRQILGLKDGIEINRLVPFRNLTMRARAILRDLTNRYGKSVELTVNNEQIELDAGVVQQIEPALLHLLRNAYDHGIETSEERLAAGKNTTGQITVALHRRGNIYRLTVQDDGRGIDAALISASAQNRGFDQTITTTDIELLAVICQPGFSSRTTVSEVSGRGVGMDVVANQITAIGGKLQLRTQLGIGTTFMIEVPAPQLLVPCVLLQTGERIVAFPAEEILETVLLSATDIQLDAEQRHWQISTFRRVAPAYSLTAYWKQFSTFLPENAIGLRFRIDNQADVWLLADDLIGQSELLINPLPHPLIPPVGMLGVSLQPDGSLISVLDPTTLAQVLQSQSAVVVSPPVVAPRRVTTILIVDDAALMRRRLAGSLSMAGFAVQACGDGLEAWQWLQTNELPTLMITDVEMPNMDGLTLIDRCRKTGLHIPILVLSSRLSEDWGKEAQRVGANEFLNKGFTTDELLSTIKNLLATPTSTPV